MADTFAEHGALALMELHVRALFGHDGHDRLVCINEPNGRPAPRFFLGRTSAGNLWRFRHDVPEEVAAAIDALCREEPVDRAPPPLPRHEIRYRTLLATAAPVASLWAGPAFELARAVSPVRVPVAIDASNAQLLRGGLEDWLPDVPTRRPFMAIVDDEHAVAVCASVRITARAHEAGVETLPRYRRRGRAADAVAGWAQAVRGLDALPLYSTSWQNVASQAVAARLGARMVGVDFHVT